MARPPQSGRAAALRSNRGGIILEPYGGRLANISARGRQAEHVTLTSGAAALAVTRFASPFVSKQFAPQRGWWPAQGVDVTLKQRSIELLKLGDGVRSGSRELRSGTGIKISWSKRSGRLQLGTHLMRDRTRARVRAYS